MPRLTLHRRFDMHQPTHVRRGLCNVPLVPLPLSVLEGDLAIGMINARDQMLLLLPDGAPHGHIIKATVQQPGYRLVLFERRQCLAHHRERLLHFCWRDFQTRGPDY